MSDIKVSEMPEAIELNNNDLLMVVQNGVNKRASVSQVKDNYYTLFERRY